jgi:hypothetical protein
VLPSFNDAKGLLLGRVPAETLSARIEYVE